MLPTPDNLTLDEIQSRFSTDQAARSYLEEIRWPKGVFCPHCKTATPKLIWKIKANPEKKIRAGLYHCSVCDKQFTVTVGTIFEDTHIPLRKWLVAWYLLCSSKKGISSLQIQRMLGLGSYRTALFMMHRIRYALAHPAFTGMPSAKFVKPERPIKFDDAMRKAMRVPPPPSGKKAKRKISRKKQR